VAVKAKDYVFHPYENRGAGDGDMRCNFRVNDTTHETSGEQRKRGASARSTINHFLEPEASCM
jgi:hypothetical protein